MNTMYIGMSKIGKHDANIEFGFLEFSDALTKTMHIMSAFDNDEICLYNLTVFEIVSNEIFYDDNSIKSSCVPVLTIDMDI